VATAGVAAAQSVAVSGSAEMGIVGGSDSESRFHQDLDVTFSMSGTADNGLTFGATVDLDEAQDDCDTTVPQNCVNDAFDDPDEDGGASIFVSGDFGTLTMGDTDGAFDWALQDVNIGSPGSIDDSETGHAGYSGNNFADGLYDGQVLRYDYSFGDFGVAVSVEADDDTKFTSSGNPVLGTAPRVDDDGETGDPVWGIGATYDGMFAGGSYGIGLGYQTVDDADPLTAGSQGADVIGVSAHASLDSGFSAAINYSQIDTDVVNGDGVHMGIGASYEFDAITVHANWGQYDWDAGASEDDATGYGLAAAYDFGGGLSAHFGYGYSDVDDGSDDESSWSFGLAMSF
jgi:outer membrane protein OmpU